MSVNPRFNHNFTDFSMKESSLSILSIEMPRNVEMYNSNGNSMIYFNFIHKITGSTSHGDVANSFIEVLDVISSY
jgi:hypothetical protein